MADRRRHLAQGGKLGALCEGLFSEREVLLHFLAFGDFSLQAYVKLAKFCRLALEQRHAHSCLAVQKVKRERQKDCESHDFEREHAVHTFTHGRIGCEAGDLPAAKRHARL